jgi:hypothetical protein
MIPNRLKYSFTDNLNYNVSLAFSDAVPTEDVTYT